MEKKMMEVFDVLAIRKGIENPQEDDYKKILTFFSEEYANEYVNNELPKEFKRFNDYTFKIVKTTTSRFSDIKLDKNESFVCY